MPSLLSILKIVECLMISPIFKSWSCDCVWLTGSTCWSIKLRPRDLLFGQLNMIHAFTWKDQSTKKSHEWTILKHFENLEYEINMFQRNIKLKLKSWIRDQYLSNSMKWKIGNSGSISINEHSIFLIFETKEPRDFETNKFWNQQTLKSRNFKTKKPIN